MPNDCHWTTESVLHAIHTKVVADARKIIVESLELLRGGPPDTFLGRETHTPFPRGDDEGGRR